MQLCRGCCVGIQTAQGSAAVRCTAHLSDKKWKKLVVAEIEKDSDTSDSDTGPETTLKVVMPPPPAAGGSEIQQLLALVGQLRSEVAAQRTTSQAEISELRAFVQNQSVRAAAREAAESVRLSAVPRSADDMDVKGGRNYAAKALADAKASAGQVFPVSVVNNAALSGFAAKEVNPATAAVAVSETPSAAASTGAGSGGKSAAGFDWQKGVVQNRFSFNPTALFGAELVPMSRKDRTTAANLDARASKVKSNAELWGDSPRLLERLLEYSSQAAVKAAVANAAAKPQAEAWARWVSQYIKRYLAVHSANQDKAMEWHAQVMQFSHEGNDADRAVELADEWLRGVTSKSQRQWTPRGGFRGGRGGRGGGAGRGTPMDKAQQESLYPKDKSGKAKCRYWAMSKTCTKGNDCKFSHQD